MADTVKNALICLIRSVICEEDIPDGIFQQWTSDHWEKLRVAADACGMAGLIFSAVSADGTLPPDDPAYARFEQTAYEETYAVFRMEELLGEVGRLFGEAGIAYIPLKGSVMRRYYPEPWMRSSGDIDILVKKGDIPRALDLLTGASLVIVSRSRHDVVLHTSDGLCLELHHTLIEKGRAGNSMAVLGTVWDKAIPQEGTAYEMPDALFYYYHIAHIAKHLENGGSGVRTFADLWLLDHRVRHREEDRRALLEAGGLLAFADTAAALSEVWFGDGTHTPQTRALEKIVWQRSRQNLVILQQYKHGGKVKYLLSRLFCSREYLRTQYPILERHPLLTPVMYVRRFFKMINTASRKNATGEVRELATMDAATEAQVVQFYRDMGLL